MDAKTVHVVFKTHLDVGFTDLAANVVRQYFESFIPSALTLAETMRENGSANRFVWTTGSWLIYEYLEQARPAERRRMDNAIAMGDIAWHALPFTAASEGTSAELFRFGLSLSQRLDARYGRQTIAAKMTDVPGHTRAIVPLLAEAGVRFLHIGVNPASSAPDVPPAFVWRSPEGAEVVVLYSAGSYGTLHVVEGLEDVLFIAHTNDNLGPPPVDHVVAIFEQVGAQFPGAAVRASTLDAFAHAIWPARTSLPVVTGELGDTWVYGLGSDPRKVAQYRELLRLRERWLADGLNPGSLDAFTRHLLLIPEHTWGLDEKTHLGDYVNYAPADLARARARDVVGEGVVPAELEAFAHFVKPGNTYSHFASSWQEQRDYITGAVASLDAAQHDEAQAALDALAPAVPSRDGYAAFDPAERLDTSAYAVAFDPATGSIIRLDDKVRGRAWATPEHTIGLFRYESFGQEDYDRWMRDYAINLDLHALWAHADFVKPGIDAVRPRPEHRFYAPDLAWAGFKTDGDVSDVLLELRMPDACAAILGSPRRVTVEYRFLSDRIEIHLQWFDKQATRLPEALWFSFNPVIGAPEAWRLDKLGQWISPLEVVRGGGRFLHAVQRGARVEDGAVSFALESLDAPLIAPGQPRLLHADDVQPQLEHGMHVLLYDNLWGTNFPMWYEEDAAFRFLLRF